MEIKFQYQHFYKINNITKFAKFYKLALKFPIYKNTFFRVSSLCSDGNLFDQKLNPNKSQTFRHQNGKKLRHVLWLFQVEQKISILTNAQYKSSKNCRLADKKNHKNFKSRKILNNKYFQITNFQKCWLQVVQKKTWQKYSKVSKN